MEEDNIGKKLIKTIGHDDLKDVVIDAAEFGLDSITDSEVVSEIPIIGTVYKLFKTGVTIRDRFLLRNILAFLLNLKDIEEEKRQQFIEKHYNKETDSENIGEKILSTLDKLNDINQVELLSLFFRQYIEGEIDIDFFYDLYYDTQNIQHHKLKHIILLRQDTIMRYDEIKKYFKDVGILNSSERITKNGKLFLDTINNSEKILRRYMYELISSMDHYSDETMRDMNKDCKVEELSHSDLRTYTKNCDLEFLQSGEFKGARYDFKGNSERRIIYKAETNYWIFTYE